MVLVLRCIADVLYCHASQFAATTVVFTCQLLDLSLPAVSHCTGAPRKSASADEQSVIQVIGREFVLESYRIELVWLKCCDQSHHVAHYKVLEGRNSFHRVSRASACSRPHDASFSSSSCVGTSLRLGTCSIAKSCTFTVLSPPCASLRLSQGETLNKGRLAMRTRCRGVVFHNGSSVLPT